MYIQSWQNKHNAECEFGIIMYMYIRSLSSIGIFIWLNVQPMVTKLKMVRGAVVLSVVGNSVSRVKSAEMF